MKVNSPNHRLTIPSTYNLLQNDILILINAMNTSFLLVSLLCILSHQFFILLIRCKCFKCVICEIIIYVLVGFIDFLLLYAF